MFYAKDGCTGVDFQITPRPSSMNFAPAAEFEKWATVYAKGQKSMRWF
jgi:hypothetical protein